MRLENFTFEDDLIGVNVSGLYLDLHNTFKFRTVTYDVAARTVEMVWQKGEGDWVPADTPAGVRFVFEDVRSFAFQKRDPEVPFTEDDCLESVGFLPLDTPAFIDSPGFPMPRSETDYVLWLFMSWAKITIQATRVKCRID